MITECLNWGLKPNLVTKQFDVHLCLIININDSELPWGGKVVYIWAALLCTSWYKCLMVWPLVAAQPALGSSHYAEVQTEPLQWSLRVLPPWPDQTRAEKKKCFNLQTKCLMQRMHLKQWKLFVSHLSDETISRVLYMRWLLWISDSFPLSISPSVVWALIQLWSRACHVGHLSQVGASEALRRLLWLRRRRQDHMRRPRGPWGLGDYGLPLSLQVQAFKVREWRSGRGRNIGLAEPTGVLLHHHALSRHDRGHESALLIHSGHPFCVSPRPGSTQDWLQTLRQTLRHRKCFNTKCYVSQEMTSQTWTNDCEEPNTATRRQTGQLWLNELITPNLPHTHLVCS